MTSGACNSSRQAAIFQRCFRAFPRPPEVRFTRLSARGFRNLQPGSCALPPSGAVLLGPNGQGKTNLLEALYYPVLLRSLRGAVDGELVSFGDPGFELALDFEAQGCQRRVRVEYLAAGRRKRIELDQAAAPRLIEAVGVCLAVAFLPGDTALASGSAALRRRYLDRTLALADRRYLKALSRYRSALAQRNAALRQGQGSMARAFDGPLATWGAQVTAARLAWVAEVAEEFRAETEWLGDSAGAVLTYSGPAELADAAAWPGRLTRSWGQDRARAMTMVGPHRDDLRLTQEGRSLREYGSTGQHRSAAVALRLLERTTLRRGRADAPVLLLDDVFAELDRGRQVRLGTRLREAGGQVFLTAPREDELPHGLGLPVWRVEGGRVRTEQGERLSA